MKKIILFGVFAITLLSCGSKVEVAASAEQIDSIMKLDKQEVPIFKDTLVSNYIKEYDQLLTEYLEALKEGDSDKISDLQKQTEELGAKAKVVAIKIKTPAQIEKYQKWIQEQNEKIKLLNTLK